MTKPVINDLPAALARIAELESLNEALIVHRDQVASNAVFLLRSKPAAAGLEIAAAWHDRKRSECMEQAAAARDRGDTGALSSLIEAAALHEGSADAFRAMAKESA